ncbi:MAG: PP2C family protein-serine/threonine phosphatase [Saprospiraceae bacterium]|nr:PP2C family protein-serine/threonine phosphatase [Saprospiraceae bacterium]
MSRELAVLEKLEKELSLKELQIKSLLTITQAINDNVSAEGLFNMYRSFLSWEMGITKMGLFIPDEDNDDSWSCASQINIEKDEIDEEKIIIELLDFNRLHTIKSIDHQSLQSFDIIIPVFHKEKPIAYSLIGGIKSKDDLYNKIQFITTITNIIAVAIENKRLFKRQIVQERLKKEIELASSVQQMLIPTELPKNDKYEISTIYQPHFNVGGDYLDFIDFKNNRFAFCIADISGKGVAAALLMANFQAMIQSLIYQYRDLETFIFALNQTVYRVTKSDKFITFFIGEVDVNRNTLKYINAGHYPPVLFNGGKIRRLTHGCTVIGAFEKLPAIQEEEIAIDSGATVMCFTDGLPDLKNAEGQYFEDKHIEDFVLKNGKLNADEFNEELLSEIERFRGNEAFPDDIAVLTCKIH